jgi:threonine dehydrogenase-like Zn-dependent dehydrogenase
MRGVHLADGALAVRDDLPPPAVAGDEVPVRVLVAGICATDLALRRGYMAFRGTPGHEFVGVAEAGPLAGERVVGEINAACGHCDACDRGLGRHCSTRTVLGILGRPGAMAERIALPARNLHRVPDRVSDDAAVFTEPLAAAFEIGELVRLEAGRRALVAGDGKLGVLCAWVLHLAGLAVVVAGRHPERKRLLPEGAEHVTRLLESDRPWHAVDPAEAVFDLAVEATGRTEVLSRLVSLVRPRGTIVLKTTSESATTIDTSGLVVHEISLVGSRCGRFGPSLDALEKGLVPVERLIDARVPLANAEEAFTRAASGGALKVLLDVGSR